MPSSLLVPLLLLSLNHGLPIAALGEPCKIANNRLDPNSHKFLSDCGPTEYCAAAAPLSVNGTSAIRNATSNLDLEEIAKTHFVDLSHHGFAGRTASHGKVKIKRGQQSVFLASGQSNSTAPAETHNLQSNATESCQPKGCRRDEFPFGYAAKVRWACAELTNPNCSRYGQFDILPPRCALDEFCPDEEDECRPLVEVGGACQLNRDGAHIWQLQWA